jgi:RHS repeat-associated protein
LKTDDAGHRTTFAYDTAPHYGLTRLGSTTFPDGTAYTFDYDALGNEAALTAAVDGGTYTFQRTFFPFGRANHVTYPDGTVATVIPTPGGLVDSVKITQGGQTVASVGLGAYTALGKPLAIVHGNGVTETLSYNGPGQLHSHAVAATSGTAPSATTLGSRVFAWNLLDDLSTITDQLNPANSYGFSYDAAGRLTTATGPYPSPQSFAYDHGGDLTGKSGMSLTYQNGLLKSAGSTRFQSDASANVAAIADSTGGATTLAWDADGRLTKMVDTSFTYDYVGRRLSKTTPGGPRTYYIAPDYEVTVLPNGQRQHTKYLRSPLGLAAAITTVDQAGTGGATSYPGVPGPGVYCFHRDHLNSPWIVTDGSGTVAARVAYLPFGEVASLTGNDVFRAKFGGRELDPETGLSDFSARYYSSTLGRFVSPDDQLGGPLGEHDVFNPFAYAGNNPATRVDPTGHVWFYHALHGAEHFFSHPGHTIESGVTHEFHKVTSGVTSDWNRVKHSAPKWLPYVVDGLLIVAGVAVLCTTPFGGPFSAMIGSALLGAGLSGLVYNATHRGNDFSWRNWGIQLGIGAAVGFVTGGLTFGAGALADGLASAGYESFVAGSAGRLVFMAFSGVVIGSGSAAFQQFLNNEEYHEPPAEGVGWAAVVGGVFGGLGSAAGELAASSDALTEEQSLEDFQSLPEEKQQGNFWYEGRRAGTSMWTKLLLKAPGLAFSGGGKVYLHYGPRWSWWDNHLSAGASQVSRSHILG